jgi:hypothetical protein
VHVEAADIALGERPVETVRDQPLGSLAPAAAAERHDALAQLLPGAREQLAQLALGDAERRRGLGPRPLREHHEREGARRCRGDRREPEADLADSRGRVDRAGGTRGYGP